MDSSYYAFRKPDAVMEASLDALLSRMTLREKVSLLGGAKGDSGEAGNTLSCARVGIPSLRMADATSGVHWWISDTTTYPATIALAASFDTDLAATYATAVARDCRAAGVHILLGPGLNLYRSPLCGRNFEYLGEDPALTSRMTVAYVRALQAQGVAATLKHFAVNYQEYDRHKVSSDVDERTLREVYLAAFEAGVVEGGAGAVMTGYNRVNGVPCAEHPQLIGEILKREWGFDGLVMSDWVSVYSALNTATAGLDLEMPFAVWMTPERLLPAVETGRLSERVIDDKVRRLLRLALSFDWLGRDQKLEDPDRNVKNAAVALEVARQSIVLLKNDGVLPLVPGRHKSVAVIGPQSDPAVVGGGGSGYNQGWRTVSFLEGIRTLFEGFEVLHSRGIDAQIALDAFEQSEFQTRDGQPGVEVAYYNNNDLGGEPWARRVEPRLNHVWKDQEALPGLGKKDFSLRAQASFVTPGGEVDFYLHLWDGAARLTIDGACVFDSWDREAFGDHVVPVDLGGGRHDLVLEFRNIRGWNSCCLGWDTAHRRVACYEAALEAARSADVVVFCGGFNHRSEGEGADRSFAMPTATEDLLLEVLDRSNRVIVVLTAGGNVDMERWHDRASAIVHTWFPGQEGGTALAEILTGAVNPSGKLPATFERRLEDRSSFDCYHDTDGDLRVELTDGVFGGYRHFDRTGLVPRYPFGFGLSYTTFRYENLTLSNAAVPAGHGVTVRFDVVNTGTRAGADAVQLYVAPGASLVPRPLKELKAFAKVFLEAGERREVTLTLMGRDFAWYNVDTHGWVVDPGPVTVLIGASATDLRLSAVLEIIPATKVRNP